MAERGRALTVPQPGRDGIQSPQDDSFSKIGCLEQYEESEKDETRWRTVCSGHLSTTGHFDTRPTVPAFAFPGGLVTLVLFHVLSFFCFDKSPGHHCF